jgi:hypothetical protein
VAHPFSRFAFVVPQFTDPSSDVCPSLCGCPILRRLCEGWVFSVSVSLLEEPALGNKRAGWNVEPSSKVLATDNPFGFRSVHSSSIGEPRKAAQGGLGKKSVGAGRLTKSEDLPPRKTCARVLRNANKQKDNPDMTARTARRISQPHCAPRAPSPTKNGASTPPSPLAQFHPRNALPRVSFAARIRKADRCLTAPLARRHSAQVLGVSASASCKARAHAQKLIDGTAIKSRANRRCFSDLQISNRR